MNETSYIRYLNYFNALMSKSEAKRLDSTETAILNEVMLRFSQRHEVLVGDLLRLSAIGSQATLHGRVMRLIASGYLKQSADPADGRRKRLMPTKLAIRHYETLSKILTQAVGV